MCFTVVHLPDDSHEMYWRPRLSCCDQIRVGVRHIESILDVEMSLKRHLASAMASFNPSLQIRRKRCYVCDKRLPCENPICEYVLARISLTQSCEEYMFRTLDHLKSKEVDVVSPLMGAQVCAAIGCEKRANPSVRCNTCRGAVYCSKKCRRGFESFHAAGGECTDFLKIWDW